MSEIPDKEPENTIEFLCPSLNLIIKGRCKIKDCPAHLDLYTRQFDYTELTTTSCLHLELLESDEQPAFSKDRVSFKDLTAIGNHLGISQTDMRKKYSSSVQVARSSIKLLITVNQISQSICNNCYRDEEICLDKGSPCIEDSRYREYILQALEFYQPIVDDKRIFGGAIWYMVYNKDSDLALPNKLLKNMLNLIGEQK